MLTLLATRSAIAGWAVLAILLYGCQSSNGDISPEHILATPLAKDMPSNTLVTASRYKDALIEKSDAGIRVSNKSQAEGGIEFHLVLEPKKKYQIAWEVDGVLNLRIQGENWPQRYQGYNRSASDVLVVDGVRKLELLFYSRLSEFELKTLRVEECRQCVSRGELNALYRAEVVDAVEKPNQDRLGFALALLDWVSNQTDFAADGAVIDASVTASGKPPGEQYFNGFLEDSIGYYCSGAAVFAAETFREFGFEAATVNFGTLEYDLTHVTVVVFGLQEGEQFYILDPTFNGYFTVDGKLASVSELLNAGPNSIDFVGRDLGARDWLFSPSSLTKEALACLQEDQRNVSTSFGQSCES